MRNSIFTSLFVLFLICLPFWCSAQIIGSTTPAVGSQQTYSYNTGAIVFSPSWMLNIGLGSITNQSQNGTTYSATITWNTAGNETLVLFDGSAPIAQLNISVLAPPPPVPTANAATNVLNNSFTANWTSVAGASSYRLDVATTSNFTTGFVLNNSTIFSNSYGVSGLSANTTYYYRARSANSGGVTSANSNVITVTTGPATPVANAATNVNFDSFTANWNAVSGATFYYVEVSTTTDFAGFNQYSSSSTSVSIPGLSGNTTYYYRVRATNGSGSSGNSSTITVTTPSTPPMATAATSVTISSFVATWTTVPGATHYLVDVSDNTSFSTFFSIFHDYSVFSATTISVTGLAAGTTYYYRIRGQNSGWLTGYSNTISVITVPTAPVSNNASAITSTSFTANWSSAIGATSYQVEISTDNFTTILSTYNPSTLNQNVTGLSGGTAYYYRVRAVNASGTSVNSSTQSTLTLPIAPTLNPAANTTMSSFTASWLPVFSATTYQLDVSTVTDFVTIVVTYSNLTAMTKYVTGLATGTTYYFRVRAYNASGASAYSANSSVSTILVAPVAIKATSITSSSFTANWNSSTNAVNYRLDVSTKSDFSGIILGYGDMVVNGTSQSVSGLAPKKSYYYRVRAVNPTGTSPNSNSMIGADLDQNYVRAITLTVAGKTTITLAESATVNERITNYNFFDGLGRPLQSVTQQGSPSKKDVVQPFAYDVYGREVKKYLPYTRENNGWYKPDALREPNSLGTDQAQYITGQQYAFYQTGGVVASDQYPFAELRFETSPANRLLEQGSPGLTWQPNATDAYTSTDRTVKSAYETNVASEVLLWSYSYPTTTLPFGMVNAGTAATPVYYAANQLYRRRSKNEQLHEVIEYSDKQGNVVLKRVQLATGTPAVNDTNYASTYYIYDDFGSLICVIPPEAVSKLGTQFYHAAADDVTKDAFLRRWAFRYCYDASKRATRKQSPGAKPVYMVYDNRDRLVMTQDGNQRGLTNKEWTFTKYDAFNRPVFTGKYVSNDSLSTMQSNVNTYYTGTLPPAKAWFETYATTGGVILGYDNKSFPLSANQADYYTVTYYDKYDANINPAGYIYTSEALVDPETSGGQQSVASTNLVRTVGQVTGTMVKNLSAGTWLRSVNYYDQKYQMVQSVSDHHKGTVTVSNIVDFPGKVIFTKRTYVVNSVSTYVRENPYFDHAGRLLFIKHATNGPTDVILSVNRYNELGQLIDKRLHSTDTAGAVNKQSVDHRYNIRGWLTKINEGDVGSLASGDVVVDYFGMELAYNNLISGLTSIDSVSYNGNISATQWSKGNGGTLKRQGYIFQYDPMNRLKKGNHYDYEKVSGVWQWRSNAGGYSERMTYDLNGNINTLLRKGFKGASMDNLTYAYTGNQLNYVNDSHSATEGFVNYAGTEDYSYDYNGNLDKDKNKSLANQGDIKYNYLNLPREIIKGTEKVTYIYDATGRKLSQEVYNGAVLTKVTDYIGELVYEGTTPVLKIIQHSEGRILPDGGNWEYQYHLKDHLGSVRVSFTTKTPTVTNYTASFESATQATEQSNFVNYSSTTFDLVDHTDPAGTTYQKVQWLNGGASGRVGLAKSISVMPGDEITASTWCKYMNLGTTGNPTSFISALAAAFGVSAGSTGDQLKLYNGLNGYAATIPGGDHFADNDALPKAFVTILFFDRNYNLVDAAWDQVGAPGAQTSPTVKQPPHDLLTITAKAPEPGYAYIFLSNEHPFYVDVYFDDVTMSHNPSPIVSSSDYYPFGLTFNSYSRENSVPNREKFQGQEHIDDLGLNWDSFRWRNYQPEIGRFFNIDPLAEKYVYNSTYAFAENKVITFRELEGLEGVHYMEGKNHVIEKNVMVLLKQQQVIPKGTDAKTVKKMERQNKRIGRENAMKLASVTSELNTFYNGSDGNGTQNSKGENVVFRFNVTGENDSGKADKKQTTKDNRNAYYRALGVSNGLFGTSPQDPQKATLIAPAAVLTTETVGGKFGETTGGIAIRMNPSSPEGGVSHEVLHTLGLPDNGYNKGGLLNSPPHSISGSEVDQALKLSYEKD